MDDRYVFLYDTFTTVNVMDYFRTVICANKKLV